MNQVRHSSTHFEVNNIFWFKLENDLSSHSNKEIEDESSNIIESESSNIIESDCDYPVTFTALEINKTMGNLGNFRYFGIHFEVDEKLKDKYPFKLRQFRQFRVISELNKTQDFSKFCKIFEAGKARRFELNVNL